MKSILMSFVLAAGLAGALAMGDDSDKPGPATTQSSQMVNKNCAVNQDEPVDPEVFVMYKGQKVGFCCKDCIADFNKDPEKYLKTMK